MIAYCARMILCSALFLLLYRLLLEKEKMHRFNRGYLLLGLLFSFVLPFFSFTLYRTDWTPPATVSWILPAAYHPGAAIQRAQPEDRSYLYLVLLIGYIAISAVLLVRFALHLRSIFAKISAASKVPYKGATLVLTGDATVPHSFLHYIFLNDKAYRNGSIAGEILLHEHTHVRQRHSLDIILVELLQAVAWFNPFLPLYRKAIRLNHEFLADAAVVNNCPDKMAYQHLLIAMAGGPHRSALVSPINYLVTKKRLIMMNNTFSTKTALVKQLASIGLMAVIALLTVARSWSQTLPATIQPAQKAVAYGTGASPEQLHEYDSTLKNMTSVKTFKNGKKGEVLDMSKCNIDRMAYLYKLMNKEQRDVRNVNGVTFVTITTPPAKQSPTLAQLREWSGSTEYGVWLDGKRIANSALAAYAPADFALYWKSKLAKNAVNYGKQRYQVELYTPGRYELAYVRRSTNP